MDFNGIYLHHANWNPNSVQNLLCRCSKHSRWIISVESHWKEMSTTPVLPWINQRMYLKDKFTKTLTGLETQCSVFMKYFKRNLSRVQVCFFFPFLAFLFLQGIFSYVTFRINFPVLPLQLRLSPFSQLANPGWLLQNHLQGTYFQSSGTIQHQSLM